MRDPVEPGARTRLDVRENAHGETRMTNRREFLAAATAASAAPMAAKAAWAEAQSAEGGKLYAAVIDGRFAAARTFGDRMAHAGAPVRVIERDMTALWQDELRAVWAEKPVAVAGLTAAPALFCLERLAWDHNMRVVFHGEHRVDADGAAHVLRVGAGGLRESDLFDAGARWPEALAAALTAHRVDPTTVYGATDAGLCATLADHPDHALVSWIIAPRATSRA